MSNKEKPSVDQVIDRWLSALEESYGGSGGIRLRWSERQSAFSDLFITLYELGYDKDDIGYYQKDRVVKLLYNKKHSKAKQWREDIENDWDKGLTKVFSAAVKPEEIESFKVRSFKKDFESIKAQAEAIKENAVEMAQEEEEHFFSMGREIDPAILEGIRSRHKPFTIDKNICDELGIPYEA